MHGDDTEKLISEINNSNHHQLPQYFRIIYPMLNQGSQLMRSWRKICLARAISAYNINWFHLCKVELLSALEPEGNISQDKRHIERLLKEANAIEDTTIHDEIQKY